MVWSAELSLANGLQLFGGGSTAEAGSKVLDVGLDPAGVEAVPQKKEHYLSLSEDDCTCIVTRINCLDRPVDGFSEG